MTAPRQSPLDSVSLRALEYCPEAIIVTMADLERPGPTIVFVNKAFERLTGFSRSESLGRSPRFLQGPATDRAVLDAMRRAAAQREEFYGEVVNYRKDGSPYVIEWKLAPMRDSSGATTHWIAVQREIVSATVDVAALAPIDRALDTRNLVADARRHATDPRDLGVRHRIELAQQLLLGVEAVETS